MTTETIYISNGINEAHYVLTVDETFGVMVHSGGALRFRASPDELYKILNAVGKVIGAVGPTASTVAPNPKESPVLKTEAEQAFDYQKTLLLIEEIHKLAEGGQAGLMATMFNVPKEKLDQLAYDINTLSNMFAGTGK